MKYSTLYKSLSMRRDKLTGAQSKAGWYKKKKTEIEARYQQELKDLEERKLKSGSSNADEILAIEQMLTILEKLSPPEEPKADEPQKPAFIQNMPGAAA